MAVYKRNYQPYEGALTEPRWRFTILSRYAFKQVFDSKLFTALFTVSLIPTLGAAVIIYLHHSIGALAVFNLDAARDLLSIDNSFFLSVLEIQTTLTFFIALRVGPGLISPDLANNALPLYLSRPFTRIEYVLGKLTVIVTLTSVVTWVASLFLFLLQTTLEGPSWMWDNLRVAGAIFFVSWTWIIMLSLLALSFSANAKGTPAAGILLFVAFFIAAGFGNFANQILWRNSATKWGSLIDLPFLQQTIAHWFFNVGFANRIPVWAAWTAMLAIAGLSLAMLLRKIRACEVVRG